jgi:DNA-binding transcriptional MerR regulator
MVNHNRTPGQFNARDLAEQAETTVRTVHYYVSEGLLPPPEGTTRNALYGQSHLARLKIIAALRAEGLSLAAIRSRLDLLSDEGVVEVLQTLERYDDELSTGDVTVLGLIEAAVVDQSSETQIVESLDRRPPAMLSRSMEVAESGPPDSARDYVDRMLNRPDMAGRVSSRREAHVRPKRPPETWHHFSIEDGIDIRVRDDRLRPERRQVETFIESVRDLARRTNRRRRS